MLAVFTVLTVMGGMARADEAAEIEPQADIIQCLVDSPTAGTSADILGTDGGRYAGRVWSDKSVYNDDVTLDGVTLQKGNADFLTVFSALGSSRNVTSRVMLPLDIVFVIDISGSMNNALGNSTRIAKTIDAVNDAMTTLMDENQVSKYSRVGIAVFSNANRTQTILPLGRYEATEYDAEHKPVYISMSGDDTFRLHVDRTDGSNTGIVTDRIRVTGGTDTQKGIYQGMKMLANASNTSFELSEITTGDKTIYRIPAMILLSDGEPTRSVNQTSWWAPEGTEELGNGSGSFYGNGMLAMMTAAYMKDEVNRHYKVASHKGEESKYATKIYTVGMGLDNSNFAKITLNPAANLNGTSGTAKSIRDAWSSYCDGNDVSVTVNDRSPREYNITHPNNGYDIASNVNAIKYNDGYRDADENVSDVFQSIINVLISAAFVPTQDTTGTSVQTGLLYTDPLGDYMEVKDVQSILLFGKEYSVTYNKATGTCSVQSETIIHPVTGAVINTNDIKITVKPSDDSTSDNPKQTLMVEVPSGVLPIRCETVDVDIDKNVQSYSTNADLPDARPIRVAYTVGIRDDIKKADGSIDLSKVSASYIEDHPTEDGTIPFYSNAFAKDKDTGLPTADGLATVEFSPSSANRYYYFQAERVIFENAVGLDDNGEGILAINRVPQDGVNVSTPCRSDRLDPEKDYYLVIDYYAPIGGGKGQYVQSVVRRTGAELQNSVKMTATANETDYIASGEGEPVLATKVGGVRLGNLGRFVVTKGDNVTDTAANAYTPTYTANGADSAITVYLGNNGRVTVPVSTLLVSKKVVAAEGVTAPADDTFEFVVTLKEETDATAEIGVLAQNLVWTPTSEDDPTVGSFTLKEGNEATQTITFKPQADGTLQTTVTLKANEALRFVDLKPGSTYTVEEKTENLKPILNNETHQTTGYRLRSEDGITGTGTLVEVEGQPTTAMTGTLSTTSQEEVNFTNDYVSEVQIVSTDMPITKNLTGRPFRDGDSFTFQLVPSALTPNAPMPVDANGEKINPLTVSFNPEGEEIGKTSGSVRLFEENTIAFTEPGEYTYVLNEIQQGNLPGITCDPSYYRFTVKVVAVDAEGKESETGQYLKIAITNIQESDDLQAEDWSAAESFEFTNTYRATAKGVSVSGTKTLGDRRPIASSDGFKTVIEAAGSRVYVAGQDANVGWTTTTQQPMPGGTVDEDDNVTQVYGNKVETAIGSTGAFKFNDIVFTAEEAGVNNPAVNPLDDGQEFRYYVYEKQPTVDGLFNSEGLPGAVKTADGTKWVYQGVTYDPTVYTCIVRVRVTPSADDPNQRVVSAELSIVDPADRRSLAFANDYNAQTQTPLVLGAHKAISGRDFKAGDKFTFELSSREANAPMPDSTSVIVEPTTGTDCSIGFGGISFNQDNLTYAADGTGSAQFHYYVTETQGDLGGVIYDKACYRITTQVNDDGKGTITAKVVEVAKSATGSKDDNDFEVIASSTDGLTTEAIQQAISFTNAYKPSSVRLVLYATKTIENKTLVGHDFEFNVYATDQNGTPLETLPDGVSNSSLSAVRFNSASGLIPMLSGLEAGGVEYTAAGTYYYVIQENLEDAADTPDVIYSTKAYLVEVTVTDKNHDGVLSVAVTAVKSKDDAASDEDWTLLTPEGGAWDQNTVQQAVVFSNIYQGVEFEVPAVTKELLGSDALEAGKYGFTLNVEPADGATPSTLTSSNGVVNGGTSQVTFDSLRFTKAGLYDLVVTENVPEDATRYDLDGDGANDVALYRDGVLYDLHSYTYQVRVEDAGNGYLSATLVGTSGSPTFANSVGFSLTKVVTGNPSDAQVAQKFPFTIKLTTSVDGEVAPNSGSYVVRYERANGDTSAEVVTFTDGKTTVELAAGDKVYVYVPQGVQYEITESTPEGWEVRAPEGGVAQGSLQPGVPSVVEFTNYAASTDENAVTVQATKTLIGRAMTDGEFQFVIQGKAGSGDQVQPIDLGTPAAGSSTAAENGTASLVLFNGQNTFGFSYELATLKAAVDAGYATRTTTVDGHAQWTLNYRITELATALPGGVQITGAPFYDFAVVVTDNGDGTLAAELAGGVAQPFAFENTYTVEGDSVSIPVHKVLNGRDDVPLKAGEFSFKIDSVAPADGVTFSADPVANGENGNATLGPISFSKAGTYTVTVSEVVPQAPSKFMTYDTTPQTVVVEVVDDGNGNLVAHGPQTPLTFTNTYKAPGDEKTVTDVDNNDVDGKLVGVGDILTYTINWVNDAVNPDTGASADATVEVTDVVPTGTELVQVNDGGTNANGTITWTIDAAAEERGTVSFQVRVLASAAENPDGITNTGTVQVGNNSPKQTTQVTTNVPSKTADPVDKLEVGQTLGFALSFVTDAADPDAEQTTFEAKVVDQLPQGLEYVAGSSTVTVGDASTAVEPAMETDTNGRQTLTWNLADLPASTRVNVDFQTVVTRDSLVSVRNVATVNGYETNPTTIPVEPDNSKRVYQNNVSVDGENVSVGDTLTYVINWAATGDDTEVKVVDALPAGLEFVRMVQGASPQVGTNEAGRTTLTWNFAGLTSGQRGSVTFEAKVVSTDAMERTDDGVGVLHNYATVNDVDITGTTNYVPGKTASVGSADPAEGPKVGDTITYSVSALNDQDAAATVVVTDVLPEHTTLVEGSVSAGGVYSPETRTIVWTFENVPSGEARTATFAVTIDESAVDTTVENKATVNIGNNSYDSNTTTTKLGSGQIALAKQWAEGAEVPEHLLGTAFQFEVTLAAGEKPLTGTYACAVGSGEDQDLAPVEGKPGVYRLSLKAGEQAVIKGLPVGASYKIAEVELPAGFVQVAAEGSDGNVVASDQAPDPAVFSNTYQTKPVSLPVQATKTVDGRDVPAQDGEFSFTLSVDPMVGVELPADTTVNNDAAGKVTFGNIVFTKTGEYTVKIDENVPDPAAPFMTYAGSQSFKVEVRDSATAQLEIYVNDIKVENLEAAFTNTYDVPDNKKTVAQDGLNVDGRVVGVGTTLTYSIDWVNDALTEAGVSAPATVTIVDALPVGVEVAEGTISDGGAYDSDARTITWSIEAQAGQRGSVSFDVTVTGEGMERTDDGVGVLANSATVNGVRTDAVTTYVPGKTVAGGDGAQVDGVHVGQVMSYQISYINTYDDPATITIHDTVPAGTKLVDTSEGAVVEGDQITWTLSDVAPGASGSVGFTVAVTEDAIVAGTVDNQATIQVGENNPALNTNPTTVEVGSGELSISKTVATSGAPADAVFAFEVALEAADGTPLAGVYACTVDGVERAFTLVKNGVYRVELTAGETAVVANLPEGARYTVTELADQMPGGFFQTAPVADEGVATNAQGVVEQSGSVTAFTNAYKTNSVTVNGSAELAGTKVLEGDGELVANEFTFQLKAADDATVAALEAEDIVFAGEQSSMETTNDAEGNWSFGDILFKKAGDYTFSVSEIAGNAAAVSYDKRVFTVAVHVYDNQQGQLVAEVTLPDGPMDFVNNYKPEPGTVTGNDRIGGSKVLEGDGELRAGEFTFMMSAANDATQQALENGTVVLEVPETQADHTYMVSTNDANGDWVFGTMTFNHTGVYTFSVAEVVGDDAHVVYDETVYTVTVTVTDNRIGVLNVLVEKSASELVFTNTYTPDAGVVDGATQLQGHKTLEGRDLVAGEFAFKLAANMEDSATAEAVDAGNLILGAEEHASSMLARNGVDGSWHFDSITFKKPGTYSFQVSEVEVAFDGVARIPGVTYDTTTYDITAVVEDDRSGELHVTLQGVPEGGFAFVNHYATDQSVTPEVGGLKVLEGRTLQEGEFSFQLSGYGIDGALVAANASDGTFGFVLPTLTVADLASVQPNASGERSAEFTYVLKEVDPGEGYRQPGVTYSSQSYTVTVTLIDDGRGVLTHTVAAIDGDGNPVESVAGENSGLVFRNAYAPTGITGVELVATKTLEGNDQGARDFSFVAEDANGSVAAIGTNAAATKGDAGASQSVVTFTEIRYDASSMADAVLNEDGSRSKDFSYTVREIDPGADNRVPGVNTYDKSIYHARVTVYDDGKGGLTVSAPQYFDADGNALAEGVVPGFRNIYTVENTEFVPTGITKVTDAYDVTDLSRVVFDYAIYPAGHRDIPVSTGVSGANGAVTFTPISVEAPGEFWYDIIEGHGGTTAGGVTYDGSLYKLLLQVSDAGDGTYTIVPSYYDTDGTPMDAPQFRNVYNTEDLTVSIDGVTKLVNGEAPGDRTFMFELIDDATGQTTYGRSDADGKVTFGTLQYSYRAPVTDDAEHQDPAETLEPAPAEPMPVDPVDEPIVDPDEPATDPEEPAEPGVTDPAEQPIEPADPIEPVEPVVPEEPAEPEDDVTGGDDVVTDEESEGEVAPESEDFSVADIFNATVAYATDDNAEVLTFDGPESYLNSDGLETAAESSDVQETIDPAVEAQQPEPSESEPISTDLGEHWYTMREVVPEGAQQNADGSWTYRGVTYDTVIYRVCVNVYDNNDGTLGADVSAWYIKGEDQHPVTSMNDVVFRNTYEATVPAKLTFEANKTLTGRDARNGEFAFVVRDAEGAEMAVGASAAAPANEAMPIAFSTLWFDKVGTYDFVIEEVQGGQKLAGVTYDAQKVLARVTVTDQGDGTLGATVAYLAEDGSALEGIPAFKNVYTVDQAGEVELTISKTLTGRDGRDGEFSFAIYNGETLVGGGRAPELKDGVATEFALGKVYFSEPGEYDLTVVEVAGKEGVGVTYDPAKFIVHVTVTDGGKGAYVCDVTYPAGGVVFSNGYKSSEAVVSLVADKTLAGRALNKGEFAFEAVDVKSGATVTTGTNDADGLVYFDKFTLGEVGSYDFTIREVKGAAAGITYDDHTFTAHVEVTDNGLGQLIAEVTYPNGNPRFANTFTPEKPSVPVDSVPKTGDESTSAGVVGGAALAGGLMIGAGMLLGGKLRSRREESRR